MNIKEQISSLLSELLTTPLESLTRTSELGTEGGFEKYRGEIQDLLAYLSKLNQVKFEGIPSATLNSILSAVQKVKALFEEIKGYNPLELQRSNRNAYEIRDQIGNKIPTTAQNLFNQTSHVLAISRTEEAELNVLRSKLIESSEVIKTFETSAKKASESAKAAAGQTGISKHSRIFLDEARKASATPWLIATILMILLTLAWGIFSLTLNPELAIKFVYNKELISIQQELLRFYLIQLAVGKIVILSILSFATSWAARNYNSEMHNRIVNIHRHNSLSTFETFVSAAENDLATKNAVLLQATQTIFQHQPTGYTKQEQPSEMSKVIEISRSLPTAVSKT